MSISILLALSILPVVLLMVFIYRQDKYQKEPIKSLAKAFIGGMIAIPLDLMIVRLLGMVYQSNTIFYTAFLQAGLPEELSKFIIFMVFIWRDKNFDEYMDGIVYASFIGLGFACVENIMYVFTAEAEAAGMGVSTSISRGLLSVPAHFLFGVVMGYFMSLAKFEKEHRMLNLLLGLGFAALAHGLFDWLLMFMEYLNSGISTIIYLAFLFLDLRLWKLGLKYIRQHQELTQQQATNEEDNIAQSDIDSMTINNPDEYKHIDWNAGDQS